VTKWLAVLALAGLAACSSGGDDDGAEPAPSPVRFDQIQVLGTHNSYHQRIDDDVFGLLEAFDAGLAASLDYDHPSLTEQLDELGARQLELDVFADPEGGLFADRHIGTLLGRPVESGVAELDEPGFKVLHVQEIDYESSCVTFVACLEEVEAWSASEPDHLPVVILVEVKDDPIPDPAAVGFVTPHVVTADDLAALDEEIRSVVDDDGVFTAAEHEGAWPSVDDLRGQLVFALDNENEIRDLYAGDLLFVSGGGAFLKLNDPVADADRIRAAVEDGILVRTRADADTVQARSGDTTMRDAALASGAQLISSDYLRADSRFTDYSVQLPGGAVARCNPVSAPTGCVAPDG
jgi:hypothetical protein